MNLLTRTTKNFAILVISIGFSCTTLAQTKPAVVDPNKAPIAAAGIDEVYQLVDAVVTKVDSKTRTVTLKDKDGTVTNFVAGPEIKNFPQIKVGDRLTVTHELAVVIELLKVNNQGIRSEVQTTSQTSAPLGSKPASVISNTTTIIATVIGIDRQKLTISVKGPKGKPDIYRIKNAALLKDIAVNDEVKIVLYDAMAASFTAPAPAAAQKK
ncbi:hypothetical protein ICV32_04855 [Polynucleobacter sp. MWH-UH24A]|uniref:hypothetical protein n=1 Tax=Polynucleobacter sp. MWH-UH24A TaxID=2689110 RepID=UPI001BFD7C0E|nr:hypothetical protein [Polynucleobacter sp. MWH-UH24A]QWD76972.1 hypothetical protein ICV32_04855 [Polynucleobacter sp. MWH-UH24A]